ncbi:MAG: DUF447 domain-containing protein [Planctomycetota bacterium]|nr:DUF447 domain-containing protein [Planctomycetota bacterium]
MILESIVTTRNPDGSFNISPMGARFQTENSGQFELRPYYPSTTLKNLTMFQQGVLHVTDDISLFVDAILKEFNELPLTHDANFIEGNVLADCCRFHEFRVTDFDDRSQPAHFHCEILHSQEKRPFIGFNRAKHAVLEVAILATRVQLLDPSTIQQQLPFLESAIQKTGTTVDWNAYQRLKQHLLTYLPTDQETETSHQLD